MDLHTVSTFPHNPPHIDDARVRSPQSTSVFFGEGAGGKEGCKKSRKRTHVEDPLRRLVVSVVHQFRHHRGCENLVGARVVEFEQRATVSRARGGRTSLIGCGRFRWKLDSGLLVSHLLLIVVCALACRNLCTPRILPSVRQAVKPLSIILQSSEKAKSRSKVLQLLFTRRFTINVYRGTRIQSLSLIHI